MEIITTLVLPISPFEKGAAKADGVCLTGKTASVDVNCLAKNSFHRSSKSYSDNSIILLESANSSSSKYEGRSISATITSVCVLESFFVQVFRRAHFLAGLFGGLSSDVGLFELGKEVESSPSSFRPVEELRISESSGLKFCRCSNLKEKILLFIYLVSDS